MWVVVPFLFSIYHIRQQDARDFENLILWGNREKCIKKGGPGRCPGTYEKENLYKSSWFVLFMTLVYRLNVIEV